MSERTQLEAMLLRAGIVFETPGDCPLEVVVHADDNSMRATIDAGYSGFFTIFTFDVDGELVQIGSWE